MLAVQLVAESEAAYGRISWKFVSQALPTPRSRQQCRAAWQGVQQAKIQLAGSQDDAKAVFAERMKRRSSQVAATAVNEALVSQDQSVNWDVEPLMLPFPKAVHLPMVEVCGGTCYLQFTWCCV